MDSIGERHLREIKGLSPQANLADDYPAFQDGFQLNENFSIGPRGLTFFFNSCEIASYAEGPTEILLPFEEIKGLLRPDADIP